MHQRSQFSDFSLRLIRLFLTSRFVHFLIVFVLDPDCVSDNFDEEIFLQNCF